MVMHHLFPKTIYKQEIIDVYSIPFQRFLEMQYHWCIFAALKSVKWGMLHI